jgi:hypothetical protein
MMTEEEFKLRVTYRLSKQLINHIDKLVIGKSLRFTQKQALLNMRDSGLMNALILGNFKCVSLEMLIDLFSVFELGLSIDIVDKDSYDTHTNPLTVH